MTVPEFPPTLPAEIQTMIDESVKTFENHWGLMLSFAKANGYIDSYRQEVTNLAMKILALPK